MADYTLTLTEEQEAALLLATEQINLRRSGENIPAVPPRDPLTASDVLALRLLQVFEPARQELQRQAVPLREMLLDATPAQRTAFIQRLQSPALRQYIIARLQGA